MWPVELIPDTDRVFYRVHKQYIVSGVIQPGAFQEKGGGMSVDWEKYSTVIETLMRAKIPVDNGVTFLRAAEVRSLEGLAVQHSPVQEGNPTLPPNRAHANVTGVEHPERKTAIRTELQRICKERLLIRPKPS